MGVQASPMTSREDDSSELADSYDSEAAKMFKPDKVDPATPEIEVRDEELESDS